MGFGCCLGVKSFSPAISWAVVTAVRHCCSYYQLSSYVDSALPSIGFWFLYEKADKHCRHRTFQSLESTRAISSTARTDHPASFKFWMRYCPASISSVVRAVTPTPRSFSCQCLWHGWSPSSRAKEWLDYLMPILPFCSCVLHPKIFLPFFHSFLLLLKNKSLWYCSSWLSQEQSHMHLYKIFALVFSTSNLNP